MNPKKILIFSTAYYPFIGGAEIAIKEITERLSGDFEFDLLTAKLDGNLPKMEKVGNVNIYRIGIGISLIDKLLLPFWGAIKTISLNKKNNYIAFWCVMVSFASGAAYIANILSSKKVPIVLTLQEGESETYLRTKWFGLVDLSWRLALKRANSVTVLSNYLSERAKNLGYKGEPQIIPNGVDVNSFEVSDFSLEERQKVRKNLNLNKNDIGLVTTSRLAVKNGIGDVIEALEKLPKNIKFVICGMGELENDLKNLAKKLNVSERVVFVGNVSHNEMPKILKSCDIFIRPSLSEGMGNSFIEAMAAGIPVIGTPVGGIVDFLYDPTLLKLRGTSVQTGYFCKPENPESIVGAVNKILNDSNKEKILENAKKLIIEKYDWNKISLQIKDIFDNMAKK